MSTYLGSKPINVLYVLFRNKKAIALYRGSTLLQNFGTPKLQADFTTGTYKANGTAKTFADLFTFSRAGKAWLVKDTDLVKYAVDAPRFDDGLLIEQAATNYGNYSFLPSDTGGLKGGVEYRDGGWFKDASENGGYLYVGKTEVGTSSRIVSVGLRNAAKFNRVINNGGNVLLGMGNKVQTALTEDGGGFFGLTWADAETNASPLYLQIEGGVVATSPILTTTAPVTRPADFLQTKVTGTTVTGDWDSTLNLSIVAGKLVHSGYGRVRSLEIN